MLAWFKVDDQLHSHPKARRAGLESMGLWLLAGSHCMSYLTDGFVEEWFVQSWGPNAEACAQRLVNQGLWLEVEGGWQFHDWDEFQPTREKVEAEREAAAERMRRVRANRTANVPANAAGTNSVGSATPSPSPSPRLLLTESVSLGSNARDENETDAKERRGSAIKLAGGMGLDLEKVRAAAAKIDRSLDHGQALRLSTIIVARSRTPPKRPTAYVLGAFKRSPYEVQQTIDTEVLA